MESEAPPSAGWYNFLGWLDANKKRVVMIGGIVIAVIAVVSIVTWRHSEQQTEAAEALSSVRTPLNPAEPLPSDLPERYLKVARQYENTPAGGQAMLRAATAYFDLNQFQQAQETFTKFISSYGDSPWVAQAQYGIAASLEAQGRTQDAIVKYNDYLQKYPNDSAADEARFTLARLYEKGGQPAQALDVLTKMTNGLPPFSQVAGEVQDRIRSIYAKNPSLVPQKAPTTITPSMLMTNAPRVATNAGSAPAAAPAAPKINLSAPTATNAPKK